jgi:hypothetical protein
MREVPSCNYATCNTLERMDELTLTIYSDARLKALTMTRNTPVIQTQRDRLVVPLCVFTNQELL